MKGGRFYGCWLDKTNTEVQGVMKRRERKELEKSEDNGNSDEKIS